MARKVEVRLWLEKQEPHQFEWVIDYILKLNLPIIPECKISPTTTPERLIQYLEILINRGDTAIITKMKGRWSTEKYRNKNNALTLVISKQASIELNNLKRKSKLPNNKIIEALISDNYGTLLEIKQNEKIENTKKKEEKAQAKRRETYGLGTRPLVLIKKLEAAEETIKLYDTEIKDLEEIADLQLAQICELLTILKSENLQDKTLNESQQEEAIKLKEKMIKDRALIDKSK